MARLDGISDGFKRCGGKCGQIKELDCFDLRRDTGKRRGTCRACIAECQQYNRKHPQQKIKEVVPEGMKRCIGECKQIKSEAEFRFRKDNGKYRNECTVCCDKRNSKYQIEHRTKISVYWRGYKESNKESFNKKRAARERKRKKGRFCL